MVEAGSVIARLDSDTEEIAVDRARIALEDAQSKLERINALKTSNTVTSVQVKDAEFVVENARLQLRDAELALERRSIVVADRRHRRHHPGRGRQLRHQRDADRHGRRPFQDHRRFLGAGALRGNAGCRRAAHRHADRQAQGRLRGHGQRSRQPGRRGEPHAAGAGRSSTMPTTRCAPACRSRSR